MDQYVGDSEPLTKFLEDKKDYQLPSGPIKAKAFYPANKYAAMSVFRIEGASEYDIWQIADGFVAPRRKDFKGEYRARADFKASEVRITGLGLEAETSEHPRHADIKGWVVAASDIGSEDAQNEIREKRGEYAAKLFQIANLVLRES